MDVNWISVIMPAAILYFAFVMVRTEVRVIANKGLLTNTVASFMVFFVTVTAGHDLMYLVGMRETYRFVPEIYLGSIAAAVAYALGITARHLFRRDAES